MYVANNNCECGYYEIHNIYVLLFVDFVMEF